MMFEIVCKQCHAINRDLLPLVKSDSSFTALCNNCESELVTFYGEKHAFANLIKESKDNV